jgi:hypothetical protein
MSGLNVSQRERRLSVKLMITIIRYRGSYAVFTTGNVNKTVSHGSTVASVVGKQFVQLMFIKI